MTLACFGESSDIRKHRLLVVIILAIGAGCCLFFRSSRVGSTGRTKYSGAKIGDPERPEPAPTLTLVSPSTAKLEVRRSEPIDCVARLQMGYGGTLPSLIIVAIKRAGKTVISDFPDLEPQGGGSYICRYRFKGGLLPRGSYELELECYDWIKRSRFSREVETRTTAKAVSTLIVK